MGKWLNLLAALAPTILATAGVPTPIIGVTVAAMNTAEQIHDTGTGPSKKAFVQALANQAIDSVVAIKPGLLNADSAKAAVQEGIDTVVAATNAAHNASTPATI